MKAIPLLLKLLFGMAVIGSVANILNAIFYLCDFLEWGIRERWHFMYMVGWGFPFLAHLEYAILALFLVAPFWIFVKKRAPTQYLAKRKLVNWLVAIGSLSFLLAVTLESWLEKIFP